MIIYKLLCNILYIKKIIYFKLLLTHKIIKKIQIEIESTLYI